MIIYNQTKAAQNQEMTIQGQIQAAQVAEQEKRATKEQEGMMDIKRAQMTAEAQNRTAVLQMATAAYLKSMETGLPIPAEIKPLIDAVMENVGLAAVVSTDEQKQLIAAQMQAAQAAAQQQMQGAGEQMVPEEMPAEEQPPLPEQ